MSADFIVLSLAVFISFILGFLAHLVWNSLSKLQRALDNLEADTGLVWFDSSQSKKLLDKTLCLVYAPGSLGVGFWPAEWDAGNENFSAGVGWFEQDEVKAFLILPRPTQVVPEKR